METKETKAKEICPTTAFKRVQEGALLVDVREKNEVAELAFDVPKIIHIPLSKFEERYMEIPANEEVILVCQGGSRSLKATYFLMNQGYTNVSNMHSGIIRWVQRGFPTIGNTNTITASSCCSSSCC